MNARLDAIPLAQARLEREKVELMIEREKVAARRASVVKTAEALQAGRLLRRLAAERLAAFSARLRVDLSPQDDEFRAHALLTDALQRLLHELAEVPDGAPEYWRSFAAGVRPRRALTVSEWADARRVLKTGTANPGPWRTSFVPYLREIMDCLSAHSPVQRIVFMKSAQVGGTEVAINWLGYVIEHAPAEMLFVMPTLDLLDRFVKRRLNRLIEETESVGQVLKGNVKRDAANSLGLKSFPGGSLILAGANSPNSLRSDAVRYVICDEVDGFEWEVGNEGDPLLLIENRMRTYARRKLFLLSTPTVKGYSRIEQEYARSDRRRYHVPCPHCGAMQPLRIENLKSRVQVVRDSDGNDRRVVTAAWYECEHCGASIEEHFKPQMLAAGRWIAEAPEEKTRGYHINALYSPIGMGLRWIEIEQRRLDALGDAAKEKTFRNTFLGETWEDSALRKVDAHDLLRRVEPYKLRTVPEGCLIVTVGVDTQDDRLAVQYLGHGKGGRWWVLDWVELPGDPGREQVWNDLAVLLAAPLRNAFGVDILPSACAIDIGGHHTDAVKSFVAARRLTFDLMAVKGASRRLSEVLPARPLRRKNSVVRNDVPVWEVGTEQAKRRCYHDLAEDGKSPPEERRSHFSDELDERYFDQLTSEVLNPVKQRFEIRKGKRNEALDTWVYAFAAAHHPRIRIHRKKDADWDRLAKMIEPKEAQKSSARETPTPAEVIRKAQAEAQGVRKTTVQTRYRPSYGGNGGGGHGFY